MKAKFTQVYQFKISLKDIKPLIWRRIQVPEDYSFWDLHVAIQDAMGWEDYHLHEFALVHPLTGKKSSIGVPDEESDDDNVFLPGWKQKIADWFTLNNSKSEYIYDFGDSWDHVIKLEKILLKDESIRYPVCIAGERACPPEDVGGKWGYDNFLKIIKNPKDEEYEDMLSWAGGKFDPEFFNPEAVVFDNPKKRLKIAIGGD